MPFYQTAFASFLCLLATAPVALSDEFDAADRRVSESHRWYANVGVSGVLFDSSSKLSILDQPVPGANAELSDGLTPTVEIGYHVTPNFSLALGLGLPPKSDFEGKGTFDGLHLGAVTFGTIITTAKYHVTAFGDVFKPYVGAGAAYTVILSDTDGALKDFNVDGEFGAVLQAGAEFKLDERRHLFTDVKKIFLDASGTATTFDPASGVPMPAKAEVELDPLVITTGIGFRF